VRSVCIFEAGGKSSHQVAKEDSGDVPFEFRDIHHRFWFRVFAMGFAPSPIQGMSYERSFDAWVRFDIRMRVPFTRSDPGGSKRQAGQVIMHIWFIRIHLWFDLLPSFTEALRAIGQRAANYSSVIAEFRRKRGERNVETRDLPFQALRAQAISAARISAGNLQRSIRPFQIDPASGLQFQDARLPWHRVGWVNP